VSERDASVVTVLVAGAANLTIAVAKAVAGLVGGSSAMLSEAVHSLADTVTEVLLYQALRRGAEPPDERHPFGHGKATYFWALMAALFTFVAGAGFSIVNGIQTIRAGERPSSFLVSYLVLAIAFVMEGASLLRTLRQARAASTRWNIGIGQYVWRTPDTTVKAVALEDAAALVGLVLAGGGLALTQTTGSASWDGMASIAIGALLVFVALALVFSNASLLVGQAVPARLYRAILRELESVEDVERVVLLLTMQLGPSSVLVAAKVDFRDESTGAAIAASSDEAERRLRKRFPFVTYVFLDPTPGLTKQ
jgi:cation diffusion facilitator family transporter